MTEAIIAGVDGRAESRDAVELASALARGSDAQLEIVAVLDYNPVPIDIEPYEVALREHFAAIFKLVDEAKPALKYRRHDLTGSSPPRALSEMAESLDAKLIVLGSTHRGPLGRVLPGSVGDRLLNGGPRAIAIAPRGYADGEPQIKRIGVGFNGGEESQNALSFATELAETLTAELRLIAVVEPPSSDHGGDRRPARVRGGGEQAAGVRPRPGQGVGRGDRDGDLAAPRHAGFDAGRRERRARPSGCRLAWLRADPPSAAR